MTLRHLPIFLLVIFCLLPDRASRAEEAPLDFESDVRPILSAKCRKCHSERVRKAGLDLSTIAGLRRGGESGEPAIADSLEASLLWMMVDGGGMPPEGEPQLSEMEIELIRRWIESGSLSEQPEGMMERSLNQHDVLPIVLLRCTACHGRRLQQGGLDLRTPSAMRNGGQSGPALVPGDPDASLMIQRIESNACPPQELLLKFFVKRPPSAEVETLRKWIAVGAPEEDVPPDVATTEPDPLVTDDDRRHWAFQPPVATPGANSIDDFVLASLVENGLTFAPEADRDTLIRRACLDLIGLPPSMDQWRQWRTSADPDWYLRMIDQLLASHHYGERWGRYWLDLAGYADSEGGISADPIRENAWKYRDYVIRSFNEDKPYDRFLLEQLAGDELVDYEQAEVITDEMVENLIATGFLRMGVDQTGSRTMNFVPERLGVIGDAIHIVSSGLMGLTMECARCHSHKYDPIPHRDYYRFKAIFQGALDEHDWLSFATRSLEVATAQQRERYARVNPPLRAELKSLESQRTKEIAKAQLAVLYHHDPNQSEEDREETLRALRVADNNRTLPQKMLVEKLRRAELLPEADLPESVLQARRAVVEIERRIRSLQRQMEASLEIRALWDRGDPSPTYILLGGVHDRPGALVGPGVPSVLTDGRTPFLVEPPFPEGTPKTGRRLALAGWLTRPDHPLTARVMVNRLWYHHFGSGLVETLENFGVQGTPPTHPQLLDWLAIEFVQHGWSIKEMHRLMMNSRTYKQSNRITEKLWSVDPQNRLLSRFPLRRMNAEALRDSLLFVCGKLDITPFGPPDPVSVDRDGLVSVDPTSSGGWRRSIYAQYRRTEIPTMMETFDYPEMGPNCVTRSVSVVSLQALMLMNNDRIRDLASSFAERVEKLVENESDCAAQVDAVYQIALSRPPTEEERQLGIEALNQLHDGWDGDRHAALVTYCHTTLNSAAFVYID